MAIQINLLKKSTGLTEKQYVLERRIFVVSLVSFIFVVVLSALVFGWNLYTVRSVSSVEEKVSRKEAEFSELKDASYKQLYIKSRLKIIDEFFKDRVLIRESLKRVFSIDIDGVFISSVSFENNEVIGLQVVADDVLILDSVFDYFREEDSFFVQVVNNGTSRSDEGIYSMRLSMTLPTSEEAER